MKEVLEDNKKQISVDEANQVLAFVNKEKIQACTKEIEEILKKHRATLRIQQTIVIDFVK